MTQKTKGYIHIYTGDGKGKTTAAFGLALRAACSGKSVFIGQFIKNMKYNETRITNHFKNITIKQLGKGCFINTVPTQDDAETAMEGLETCREALLSGNYDIVILDELTIALNLNLIPLDSVMDLLNQPQPHPEIIITGRYAPQEIIEIADLVTEMREIKHYYTQGVLARDGIDK